MSLAIETSAEETKGAEATDKWKNEHNATWVLGWWRCILHHDNSGSTSLKNLRIKSKKAKKNKWPFWVPYIGVSRIISWLLSVDDIVDDIRPGYWNTRLWLVLVNRLCLSDMLWWLSRNRLVTRLSLITTNWLMISSLVIWRRGRLQTVWEFNIIYNVIKIIIKIQIIYYSVFGSFSNCLF